MRMSGKDALSTIKKKQTGKINTKTCHMGKFKE